MEVFKGILGDLFGCSYSLCNPDYCNCAGSGCINFSFFFIDAGIIDGSFPYISYSYLAVLLRLIRITGRNCIFTHSCLQANLQGYL